MSTESAAFPRDTSRPCDRLRRASTVVLALVGLGALVAACGGAPSAGVASVDKTSSTLATGPAGTTPISPAAVR
jgi:hypothetical protein